MDLTSVTPTSHDHTQVSEKSGIHVCELESDGCFSAALGRIPNFSDTFVLRIRHQYRIGQLYMITKHSAEQSGNGEGVAVIRNEPCEHEKHGTGQFTEKRIFLSSRLPSWISGLVPNFFYITEKAWNFYPYTITEYTCSFVPRFSINIESRYEDNAGTSENCLGLSDDELSLRQVDFIDIATDPLQEKHYKLEEDPTKFTSTATGRGPLVPDWRETTQPIMCSYKVVRVKFEVWGLQTKVEDFVHRAIRDILLLGHRQAFTWIDEWYGMTMDDIRQYENRIQNETNQKVGLNNEVNGEKRKSTSSTSSINTPPTDSPETPKLT